MLFFERNNPLLNVQGTVNPLIHNVRYIASGCVKITAYSNLDCKMKEKRAELYYSIQYQWMCQNHRNFLYRISCVYQDEQEFHLFFPILLFLHQNWKSRGFSNQVNKVRKIHHTPGKHEMLQNFNKSLRFRTFEISFVLRPISFLIIDFVS